MCVITMAHCRDRDRLSVGNLIGSLPGNQARSRNCEEKWNTPRLHAV